MVMKIGILGGAFDPPHLGHLIVAEQIRDYMQLDEIWLMPVASHPFSKELSATSHRLAMTQLIETSHIKTSDFEHKKNPSSITIETMRLLAKEYPKDTFYWCMGSDLLPDFYKWDEWQSLITDFQIVVYPRGTGILDLELSVRKYFNLKAIPKNITLFSHKNVVMTNISSSIVRDLVRDEYSVKYILPEKIIEYIKKHKLYKEEL